MKFSKTNAAAFAALLLTGATLFAQPVTIQNDALEVRYDAGGITILARQPQRTFVRDGTFGRSGGSAKISSVSDKTFGAGQAIEVSYPDGVKDSIALFPRLPFALIRSTAHNGGKEISVTQKVKTFAATADLGQPAKKLKTLGTGGLLAPDDNPGSYVWLALAEPATRNGVVFGWLTEDRGNGVVFTRVEKDSVRLETQIDYGRLHLAPGASEDLETLAVGYFDDARLGLESWADAVAKVYHVQLPPQPTGYCTWYSQPYGGASDEEHLAENSAFAAKELKPFGFSVIQIDDKWQLGVSTNGPKRNFTGHNPDGPYPSGMKAAADKVKALGLVPGIWFMPFAGTPYDPFFKNHQDWFVKHEDGRVYDTKWGGTCLDMTYAPAREHLSNTVSRITHDWGFQYIKIDGLWTGTATPLEYVNTSYKDDHIGDAVFHNPDKSNLEAFRDGLKLVRAAGGSDIFILGCNGPQNMRSYAGAIGLVDGMRIGPDNKSDWRNLLRGPTFGSRHYFMNRRVWYNDPDPVYVRTSVPLNQAQLICSWAALSGQLNLSSEWYPGLPADRVDILKRTMPNHSLLPRPADLFDTDLPSLWLLTDPAHAPHTPRRDVVGMFNWEDSEQKFDYPLDKLGLDANTEYVVFDFWHNTLLPSQKGNLRLNVPGQTCRILAVRPRAEHPQLISTSRHVTQGIVDVTEERWQGKTLSGRSRVVAGDPYELRIIAPDKNWNVQSAKTSADANPTFTQKDELIRVTLDSKTGGDVSWSVEFK